MLSPWAAPLKAMVKAIYIWMLGCNLVALSYLSQGHSAFPSIHPHVQRDLEAVNEGQWLLEKSENAYFSDLYLHLLSELSYNDPGFKEVQNHSLDPNHSLHDLPVMSFVGNGSFKGETYECIVSTQRKSGWNRTVVFVHFPDSGTSLELRAYIETKSTHAAKQLHFFCWKEDLKSDKYYWYQGSIASEDLSCEMVRHDGTLTLLLGSGWNTPFISVISLDGQYRAQILVEGSAIDLFKSLPGLPRNGIPVLLQVSEQEHVKYIKWLPM